MSDLSEPQMGELPPRPETTISGSFGDALGILDQEHKAVETAWRIYNLHLKELIGQLAQRLDAAEKGS